MSGYDTDYAPPVPALYTYSQPHASQAMMPEVLIELIKH